MYYRALKTGCQIEKRQLGFLALQENCMAINLLVAWRTYYLTMLGRIKPQMTSTWFFQGPGRQEILTRRHYTFNLPGTPPARGDPLDQHYRRHSRP